MHRSFQFKLPLSGHIQRPDQIAQRVCRYGDSNCEKKKRCDDHSDSDESEPASSPAFSVFRIRNRKNLDEEGDHVATGGQHHPTPKHTKDSLRVPKLPVKPLFCWAIARLPRNASKGMKAPPFRRSADWMDARP